MREVVRLCTWLRNVGHTEISPKKRIGLGMVPGVKPIGEMGWGRFDPA